METMTCTECEKGHLVASTYGDDFRHGGALLHVEGLECYICDHCGADPIYTDQIRRNQLRIADAKRSHDGMLTGAHICAVRKQLGLTQAQASEVFGGGANAFSKYERGDVIQSAAMDKLLKVAQFMPDAAEFLRIEAGYEPHGGWTADTTGYVRYGCTTVSQRQLHQAHLGQQEAVVSMQDYRERRCA